MYTKQYRAYICDDCGQEKFMNSGGLASYTCDTDVPAGRLEFIGGLVFFFTIYTTAFCIGLAFSASSLAMVSASVMALSVVTMYLCSIACVSLIIRRSMDAGHQPLNAYLFFVPILGLFYVLYLFFARGVEVSDTRIQPKSNVIFLLIKGLVGLLVKLIPITLTI